MSLEKPKNTLEIKRFENEHNRANRGLQFLNNEFIGFTIECPNLFNQPFISCISPGRYIARKVFTEERGYHWRLDDTNGRTDIIISHSGSYRKDFEGCTGLGNKLYTHPKTGQRMILNTRKMCAYFMQITAGFDVMEVIIT